MKVCKKCGTLYNEKEGPCPKCYTEDLLISGEAAKHEIDTDMTPEEAEKARKKSWIQILIGMPLFIGFIYIIFLHLFLTFQSNLSIISRVPAGRFLLQLPQSA